MAEVESLGALPLSAVSLIFNDGLARQDVGRLRATSKEVKTAVDSVLFLLAPRLCHGCMDYMGALLSHLPALRSLDLSRAEPFAACSSYSQLRPQLFKAALEHVPLLTSLTLSSSTLRHLGSLKWAHDLAQQALAGRPTRSAHRSGGCDSRQQVAWLPDWLAPCQGGIRHLCIKEPGGSDHCSSDQLPVRLGMRAAPWAGSLTHLELVGVPLRHLLPAALGQPLPQLQQLTLAGCQLQPPALAALLAKAQSALPGLTRLLLADNDLLQLPRQGWSAVAGLQELDLSHNQLLELPADVLSALPNLTALNLSHNQLKQLPPSLGSLSSLTSLDVSHNWLSGCCRGAALADLVTGWPSLARLGLSNVSDKHGGLVLPPGLLGHCSRLQELRLGPNRHLDWPSLQQLLEQPQATVLRVLVLPGSLAAAPAAVGETLAVLPPLLALSWA